MLINAEVTSGRHTTTRWFREGHEFKSEREAEIWAETAFKPGVKIRLFIESSGRTLSQIVSPGKEEDDESDAGEPDGPGENLN